MPTDAARGSPENGRRLRAEQFDRALSGGFVDVAVKVLPGIGDIEPEPAVFVGRRDKSRRRGAGFAATWAMSWAGDSPTSRSQPASRISFCAPLTVPAVTPPKECPSTSGGRLAAATMSSTRPVLSSSESS
nr:hypothetical protein [Fodinicola feengrottensis]